jgi:hypothetical protein
VLASRDDHHRRGQAVTERGRQAEARQASAIRRFAATILETTKLHDIDPMAYLVAALKAADRGEVLLPWQFVAKP